ncbi:MAG: isomerizing glutamine--fructose-6-phosphate transaminase, partial [Oscillospiraceae bacterium]|nr:isomerizing glutamine--fructose-6-phosphate transaminase [Oscillospiraceae bacterium]
MCGIVGFTGGRDAAPILLDGLKKLEYRGYDSAGIAVMDGVGISVSKVRGRIAKLCEKTRDGAAVPGRTGIGHTRWATHGAPTEENAHPHLSSDGRFAVVHNGIIENYIALREELTGDGYRFLSETDTEVIVHLIEKYYAGSVRGALIKAANRLRGSYALGVICSDEPGRIYAVREASPLILGVGVGENFFASDVTALVNHTRNVIYLEDGEFAELSAEDIKIFDCSGRELSRKASRILWDIQAAEKGGYDHFMLKEIMEQPAAVRATVAPRIRDGRIDFEELAGLAAELPDIRKIIITACGSAYYAGCAGKYALERLCR